MKLFSALSLAACAAIAIGLCSCSDDDTTVVIPDQTNAPKDVTQTIDPDFAALLVSKGYIKSATQVQDTTLAKITVLDVSGNPLSKTGKLTSLAGIEHFKNLTTLIAKSQAIESLDLSANTALTAIDVQNNKLTSITLPQAENLQEVNVGRNQLTELNASNLPNLEFLDCSYNNISQLDITGTPSLLTLYVNSNNLSSIDISNAAGITAFGCDQNPGNGSVFAVKAWFDNTNIPSNFTSGSWTINGATVAVDYSTSL